MLLVIISCSKDIVDDYYITVENNYFEPLYNVTFGNTCFDTLDIEERTSVIVVEEGQYLFSSETASDLRIESVVDINGDIQEIYLYINGNGILINE